MIFEALPEWQVDTLDLRGNYDPKGFHYRSIRIPEKARFFLVELLVNEDNDEGSLRSIAYLFDEMEEVFRNEDYIRAVYKRISIVVLMTQLDDKLRGFYEIKRIIDGSKSSKNEVVMYEFK